MLLKFLPRGAFGSHFRKPYGCFNRFHLTKEGPDSLERVLPPVLEKPCRLRCYKPVGRTGQPAPLIHLLPHLIDDGDWLVALLTCGNAGLIVKLEVFLDENIFALARLWYGCNELRSPARFDHLLRRLAARVHFPMPGRVLVGRVENRMFKKAVFHRSRTSFWPTFPSGAIPFRLRHPGMRGHLIQRPASL
jgi:hypothetical protein